MGIRHRWRRTAYLGRLDAEYEPKVSKCNNLPLASHRLRHEISNRICMHLTGQGARHALSDGPRSKEQIEALPARPGNAVANHVLIVMVSCISHPTSVVIEQAYSAILHGFYSCVEDLSGRMHDQHAGCTTRSAKDKRRPATLLRCSCQHASTLCKANEAKEADRSPVLAR